MKYPLYKSWLSYFTDVSIEKSSSDFNPYLEVRLVQGRHQLVTKDAVYSFDDKYYNFLKTFRSFNWEYRDIDDVLLLGLGLGSVVYILENIYNKIFNYVAVEIDPEICRLAQKYTLGELDSFTEVYPMDGIRFLEQNDRKFDLIIMDIFQSAVIPGEYQSKNYLNLMQDSLVPDGCILYNRMNITKKDKSEIEVFREQFGTVFPEFAELSVKDNIIFVSNRNYLK